MKYDKTRLMRVLSLVVFDAVLINLVPLVSLLIRFEFSISSLAESGFVENYFSIVLAHTVVTLVIFAALRLYRSMWAYAGVEELRNVCVAVLLSSMTLWGLSKLVDSYLPRSLPVINCLLLTSAMAGSRLMYRALRQMRNRFNDSRRITMLIGAGDGGALVLRDLESSERSGNKVVCIIDDDPKKHGTYMMGVRVVGGRDKIVESVRQFGITDIILAIPSAKPCQRRALISICQKTGCRIRILPGIYQMASGQVTVQPIRDVQVEDLLGREKIVVDQTEIGTALEGKTILVTGGGGSIGSELCRQVASHNIKKLIIFDIYENNAYDIQQELCRTQPDLDLEVLIGSIRDEKRVNDIFEKYLPDVVCHAAAHKHVPLMEDSPAEAIKNNVFGTLNVAMAADRYGAESFTLISSDKAVNPTNIMGASKRVCEMIIQTLGKTSATRFSAVRFGNVLGSNGSVIPLFKKQIQAGGPVTVTHKDIIRYFMTISEAVSLVLQACIYAQEGEVFVLDMGEPVRIDDLARNMIRLSGLEPDVDIKITYTGLRPGEKLFEELLMQDEGLDTTPNQLIFIGHFNDFDRDRLMDALDELRWACEHEPESVRGVVKKLVPTYHPAEELTGASV